MVHCSDDVAFFFLKLQTSLLEIPLVFRRYNIKSKLELSSYAVKNSQKYRNTRLTFRAKIFLFFLSSSDPWCDWALVNLRCWWIFKRPRFPHPQCKQISHKQFPNENLLQHVWTHQIVGIKRKSFLAYLPPGSGLDVWEKSKLGDEVLSHPPNSFLPSLSLSFLPFHLSLTFFSCLGSASDFEPPIYASL
jgi:hypothetical protein